MTSALLIIDVQQALCFGQYAAFDIDRVVDRINVLSAKVRAADIPVVMVQHEDSNGPLRFGTDGWQLYARLQSAAGDIRLRKTASDAFHKTELHATLRSLGVNRLMVCGLQSELCVDSTVRGALAHGYTVVLVADAHTTVDNGVLSAAQISAHHNVALTSIDSYGPTVVAVEAAAVRISG